MRPREASSRAELSTAGPRGIVPAALKVCRTHADARGMTFILIAAPAVALVGLGAVVFTAALRQIPELLP